MKSALEQNGIDPKKVQTKISNDAADFDFALKHCIQLHQFLDKAHLEHLAENPAHISQVLRDFMELRLKVPKRNEVE